MVKLALMPTRAKHRQTSPYLILLEREYNMYFKAYYSIASRQPIFVLLVACSSALLKHTVSAPKIVAG